MYLCTLLRSRTPLWLSWSSVMNFVVRAVRLFSARLNEENRELFRIFSDILSLKVRKKKLIFLLNKKKVNNFKNN